MTDDQVIDILRLESCSRTAAELAALLSELLEGGFSAGSVVTYFKRAFPEIPLRTVIEASVAGAQVGERQGAEAFNSILGKWLPRRPAASSSPGT